MQQKDAAITFTSSLSGEPSDIRVVRQHPGLHQAHRKTCQTYRQITFSCGELSGQFPHRNYRPWPWVVFPTGFGPPVAAVKGNFRFNLGVFLDVLREPP